MRRNKRLLATLDFETDPFEYGCTPRPFAVGLLIEGGEYHSFWGDDCVASVMEVVENQRLRVYAHNGGRFDYFFLLDYLDPDIKLIGGRISRASAGESLLYDSYLILPMPLGSMQKDVIDYQIMRSDVRNKPENRREIMKYLEGDCNYLFDWVAAFIDRFGCKLTVAAAAFDEVEDSGYPCKKPSYYNYDDTFRPFYFGGRTQAFSTGAHDGEYKVFDLNSAYPEAMMHDHPFGVEYVKIDVCTVPELKALLTDCPSLFAVVECVSKGCLPFRSDDPTVALEYHEDDIVREYHATGWELIAGFNTGSLHTVTVISVLVHSKTKDFRKHVEKFFGEKTVGKISGDRQLTEFSKLMLNTPYGKMGANGRKYKSWRMVSVGELPFDDVELNFFALTGVLVEEEIARVGWRLENNNQFGYALWSRPDPVESFYNVAVAASITGYVRAVLWSAIYRSGGVLYCDTDSLICLDFQGGAVHKTDLGAWDCETIAENTVYIGGRKLYTMECNELITSLADCCRGREIDGVTIEARGVGDVKVKKAHKGSRLTHEQIVSLVLDGKDVVWRNEAPTFSLSRGTSFVERTIKAYDDDQKIRSVLIKRGSSDEEK